MAIGIQQTDNQPAVANNNNNHQQQYGNVVQGLPPPPAAYPPQPTHAVVNIPAGYASQPQYVTAASPVATTALNKTMYVNGQQGPNVVAIQTVNIQDDRLPCCGIGIGWFLFILGWFLGIIPWYVGAIKLCFTKLDRREKPGHIACAVMAVLGTVLVIVVAIMQSRDSSSSSYDDYYGN